ncbi:hypothetical protein OAG71_03315 [bacterium]|nr:hypothetical protein [bacterium]
MLSTVSIFAQGSTGQENFEVSVNGSDIALITNASTELTEYQFDVADGVDADDIQIEFINDVYDPANGIDRNLTIDRIEIGNLIFETEDPAVFSTGVFTDADGIQAGFGRGETLNANGFFAYRDDGFSGFVDADGTEVTIDATGFGDEIRFELQVDGETVQNFEIFNGESGGQSSGIFNFTLGETVSPERIRVAFTNDATFTTISGESIDRNLQVNSVNIDGEVFRGTDSNVFSTGTFADGEIVDGFGRGNTLHANGFFRFGAPTAPTTQITVDATAVGVNVDQVQFEIQIDGVSQGTFGIVPPRTNNPNAVFNLTVDGQVDPSQVRIVFINDFFGTTFNGSQRDRNLQINSLSINGVSFDPADSSVLSTGTFREEDGIVAGFGRGNILHSNGFFQFA